MIRPLPCNVGPEYFSSKANYKHIRNNFTLLEIWPCDIQNNVLHFLLKVESMDCYTELPQGVMIQTICRQSFSSYSDTVLRNVKFGVEYIGLVKLTFNGDTSPVMISCPRHIALKWISVKCTATL